jgi:prophage regulatory protein
MRIVRFRELSERKGITWSRTHVDREERAGRFPQRVKIGPNSIGWVEDEIDQWLAERAQQREKVA